MPFIERRHLDGVFLAEKVRKVVYRGQQVNVARVVLEQLNIIEGLESLFFLPFGQIVLFKLTRGFCI